MKLKNWAGNMLGVLLNLFVTILLSTGFVVKKNDNDIVFPISIVDKIQLQIDTLGTGPVHGSFLLENTSLEDTILENIYTSCRCLSVSLSTTTVPAGQKIIVYLTYINDRPLSQLPQSIYIKIKGHKKAFRIKVMISNDA